MKRILSCTSMLILSAAVNAAGFDSQYEIRVGDYDSDGLLDLFVSGHTRFIEVDDIPIVIAPTVPRFVLRNNGSGDFELVTAPIVAKVPVMRVWPVADLMVSFSDVNVDGFDDLTIRDASQVIAGTRGQIVFAGHGANKSPVHIRAIDASLKRYKSDLMAWLIDNNYFNKAPLKVTGQQPATAGWEAAIVNPTNVRAINSALTGCAAKYLSSTNKLCALNTIDPPPPCTKSVIGKDADGNVLGTTVVDVCQYDLHVYVYTQGSVQVSADTSVFDTDAKDTAHAIEQLDSCPARSIIPANVATEIERIMANVFKSGAIFDQNGPLVNTSNSVSHPPFPGDGAFPPSDPTYHHFDVTTRICRLGTNHCDSTFFTNVARRFTFPYVWLRPHDVSLNGTDRELVYVSPGFGGLIDVSRSYFLPIGHITQTQIGGGYWAGAVQNVTANDHLMWPGTVNRALIQDRGFLTGFTHGVGYNKQLCTTLFPDVGYNALIALANDVYGHDAFQALDVSMVKYFKDQYLTDPPVGLATVPPADVLAVQ